MRVAKGVTIETDDPDVLRDMLRDFVRYCHEDPRGYVPGTVTIHDLTDLIPPWEPRRPPWVGKMTWEAAAENEAG